MMIINRLAHYVKVLQREQIGAWKERQDLERELNSWIKQYVADQENHLQTYVAVVHFVLRALK